MFKLLCLLPRLQTAQTSSSSPPAITTTPTENSQTQLVLPQIRLNGNTNGCGDDPSNTYFISKNSEFSQISQCLNVNSSIFINGEYDVTTLEEMTNITNIYGDFVIQNSHTIYNLKGLQNLQHIYGTDLYLDRYAVYINGNENLGYVNRVNWTNLVDGHEYLLNYNTELDHFECYNQCEGCFGPGPYLCQECTNYTFYDNSTCTSHCDNILYDNVCQVHPPTEVFLDYINGYSFVYLDWGSNDIHKDLITNYLLYHNDNLVINTSITDDGYYFNQTELVITHTMTDLVPGSVINCSIIAGSHFGYSTPVHVSINLPSYTVPNFTHYRSLNPDNNQIHIDWELYTLPNELFFTENNFTYLFEYYYTIGNQETTGITRNNSLSLFNLTFGEHVLHVKPVLELEHNDGLLYFSGDFQPITINSLFTTTTTTTTSSTITRAPVTGGPGFTTTTPQNQPTEDYIVALAIFLSLLGAVLVIVLYIWCKDKQKKELLNRLHDSKIVQYSNPVYETTGYSIGDSNSSLRQAQRNPIYYENDPEQDYYTV